MATYPPRPVDADAFQRAVLALTAKTPIATSEAVKGWLDDKGCDWRGADKGRSWRLLELADHMSTHIGRVKNWKKKGAKNAMVGWSRPEDDQAAARWAAANGWSRSLTSAGT